MNHYSKSDARKNFSEIINRVKFEKVIISVGSFGEDEVYIVPKLEVEKDLPITDINTNSSSFNFLEDEPEIYSLKDIKKQYV